MKEFIKELEQLPQDRKEAITKGLQNQIIAQAIMVRDEQPEIYLSYLDSEIESASNAMLKMVKASGLDGAILGNISEVYIWNKERKRLLIELKDMFITQQPQSLNPEPQPRASTQIRKGRPKATLKDIMIDDTDGAKLQKIHNAMKGKKGKIAALIILACILKGWMPKPTFTQVENEFGDVGKQQGFTKYLNKECFSKDELEGAIKSLD